MTLPVLNPMIVTLEESTPNELAMLALKSSNILLSRLLLSWVISESSASVLSPVVNLNSYLTGYVIGRG